ncbi:hypothetical protein C8F01DRAFT_1304002 [Mycena amicta]|nr:hypothetical protein C8F01DRAFT_1304002 [Mycena amicta]
MPQQSGDNSGYTSETGLRNNPTLDNFRDNVKMEEVATPAPHTRKMNHQGRAIARIVYNSNKGWTQKRIADIMGVRRQNITYAVGNTFNDDVTKDFDYVDNPAEWRKEFPPDIEVLNSVKAQSRVGTAQRAEKADGDSSELQGTSSNSELEDSDSDSVQPVPVGHKSFRNSVSHDRRTTPAHISKPSVNHEKPSQRASRAGHKKPYMQQDNGINRKVPKASRQSQPAARARTHNSPGPSNRQSTTGSLFAFLSNVKGYNMTDHLALFQKQGIKAVADLLPFASLDKNLLIRVLTDLFAEGEPGVMATGEQGLKPNKLLFLELAINDLAN